ncbi:hypothetical protein Nepgr_026235 [Nepenthes gracilis]|uniref:Uncharacterized protein n=1 Tax=Nepenthes gracilis TaxID=150966 RepID=A0AAD3T9D8_NEPGR|nr:hypothetical protein Nepgr_026235 [Nepenthes gracilis]
MMSDYIYLVMDEERREEKSPGGREFSPKLDAEQLQKDLDATSDLLATSPLPMRKSPSTRSSCLCSPTTHLGSFRCRHHRNGDDIRRGHSVGSGLSELADRCISKSNKMQSELQHGDQLKCQEPEVKELDKQSSRLNYKRPVADTCQVQCAVAVLGWQLLRLNCEGLVTVQSPVQSTVAGLGGQSLHLNCKRPVTHASWGSLVCDAALV